MRFRVWCLSWDDTEENGMDVVGYDPVTESAPRKGEIQVAFYNLASPDEAAEIYADYCHDDRDGHEDKWPLKFRVKSEDGSVHDFEVERDFVTEFEAHPVKPQEGK